MLLDLFARQDRDPAECLIIVDGAEIDGLYPFLLEVRVECSRTEAATATLTFETRRNELGTWTVQDAGILEPWARIVITAAFGSREEEVMRGYIREVRLETPEDAGMAQVVVECQDDSLRLDRTHRRRTWGTSDLPTSDTLILNEILASYGLLSHQDSESGQDRLVGIAQDDTDIKFLKSRSEFNGYELIFREGRVYFGPMRLEVDPQSTILVYGGEATNCLSLSVRANGHQPDAVAYDAPTDSGDSVDSPEPVRSDLFLLGTSRADSRNAGLEDFVWRMSAEAGADAQRLQALAQMKANDLDIHRIQGEGELDGSLYGHVLQAGLPVPVDGLGERMSGIYYVDSVSHSFTAVGYRQRFRLLRNGYGDNLDMVSGLMRSLAGVI
ncbi:MAG: phage late control D family protein [Desulfobulbus sp.]